MIDYKLEVKREKIIVMRFACKKCMQLQPKRVGNSKIRLRKYDEA